ncbi:MAG: response regulator [Deltaproteobacteria bacterium]|nr:response regulator [Deltaproteobacteria bacterium]
MGSIVIVQPDASDSWAPAVDAAGHAVQVASTTRDAMLLVCDGGIDLVIIDTLDPRVGLVDLARKIAALPDAPPIVLVSGSPHAPEISARIGAAVFLPKPCEPAELVAVIDRLVGQHRSVRAIEDEPTGPRTQF